MSKPPGWDVRYEWKAVTLLTLAFGLVGLDRFALNPLFPAMMKDLGLTYQDLGNVSAVLGVAWGVAGIAMGPVSDRFGRRIVIIPAVLIFSLMSVFTGLVTGIGSLLIVRAIMGLSEGAFQPATIAATIEASKPTRRGLNFGIEQNGLMLVGLALGPIIVTNVLVATGSWRLAFVVVALPGLVVAYLLHRVLRDTQGTLDAPEAAPATGPAPGWRDLFRYRNIVLACLNMVCLAGSLLVVIAMAPSYLVDFLKVPPTEMGFIMSGVGVGAIVIGTALAALSDRVGRKPVMLAGVLFAALATWVFMQSPADPLRLFLLLGAITGFGYSVIIINNGPLVMESAPASLSSSAAGLIQVGEIVAAGAAVAAGFIAQRYGIEKVFQISLVLLLLDAAIILLLREPRKAPKTAGTELAGETG